MNRLSSWISPHNYSWAQTPCSLINLCLMTIPLQWWAFSCSTASPEAVEQFFKLYNTLMQCDETVSDTAFFSKFRYVPNVIWQNIKVSEQLCMKALLNIHRCAVNCISHLKGCMHCYTRFRSGRISDVSGYIWNAATLWTNQRMGLGLVK